MTHLSSLAPYVDERGNEVVGAAAVAGDVAITFRGSNNRLVVHPQARFRLLHAVFDCSEGTLVIGKAGKHGNASWSVRVGQDATVAIGDKVTTTGRIAVSAVEGARISIGDDVMIASDIQIRGDDGHPIFDVRTGKRVNPARDITIGDHVWIGLGSSVLGGADIGTGSVIGTRSVVTGAVPNNCVAVGSPARVVRRDIAWERPHLSFDRPPYKPEVSVLRRKTTRYWNLTQDAPPPGRLRTWLRRRLRGD